MPQNITNIASDKELIIEIKASSQNAFKILFNNYYKPLIDFCLYRRIDLDISKDIVQEIFTYIWQSRDKLDPDKSIKSFLYKSVTNKIINYIKHSSSKTLQLDESISPKPQNNGLTIESKIDIYSAIEKLPEKLKSVFMLSRIEGFKYSEIAEISEISVKAVEKRMTKALKLLRKSIS